MGRRQRALRVSSPAPQRLVEDEELDIDAFSNSLEPFGFAIRDVSNDGNCFFRAVSDQLYGTEEHHMSLREGTCEYLLENKEHYQHFVDDEQSFDEYVSDMKTDGVWADNLELQAVSMKYSVNIRVHQSGKPSYDIRNHPGKNAKAIHLSYHFGEHYASVRPLATANLNVPAQHDPLPIPRALIPSSGEASSASAQEKTSRRPRHGNRTDDDSVAAVWNRAERGHCDLRLLVEKTKKAARAMRVSEPNTATTDGTRVIAKSVEHDMKEALERLEEISEWITDGKSTHRARVKKLLQKRREAYRKGSDSESEIVSTDTEEDGDERYVTNVREKTDWIFTRLDETENAVQVAVQQFKAVTGEQLRAPVAVTEARAKTSRRSKRKEQEARRRERKERRRREQERIAQHGDKREETHLQDRRPQLDIAI